MEITLTSKIKQFKKKNLRKIIAIGDLHGDYHRLARILKENNILMENNWNPQADYLDLILIGDYVDWRGEPLEGDRETWIKGPKAILDLIKNLSESLKNLKKENNLKSNFYPLLGNHDQMMLDALNIFNFLDLEEVNFIALNSWQFYKIKKYLLERKINQAGEETVLNFLNWFYQGGEVTLKSFGGLEIWRKELAGYLGSFLKNDLNLFVKVNQKFFSHSIPDDKKYWKPLGELKKDLKNLPEQEKKELI
ncbi:MAG: metallophosphoesterase, partial [Armatimonadetes bacterium]|nr:metallophosphoesterase [Armatimonadota bacterium]